MEEESVDDRCGKAAKGTMIDSFENRASPYSISLTMTGSGRTAPANRDGAS